MPRSKKASGTSKPSTAKQRVKPAAADGGAAKKAKTAPSMAIPAPAAPPAAPGFKIKSVWLGAILVCVLGLVILEVAMILKGQADLTRSMTCVGAVGKRGDNNVPGTFKGTYLEKICKHNRLFHIDEDFGKVIVYELKDDTVAFELDAKKAGMNAFVPRDVAEDTEGNIFVLEANSQRAVVFSPQGEFLRTIQLTNANSIAIDDQGNLFYSNPAEKQIFEVDSKDGRIIRFFGRKQFKDPWRQDTDKNGMLYVLDKMAKKVLVFDANGKFKRAWSDKIENVDYARLQVAGDKIYINDFGGNSVNIYSLQGKLQAKVQVRLPGPMAVDEQGRIYVAGPDGVQRYSMNEN